MVDTVEYLIIVAVAFFQVGYVILWSKRTRPVGAIISLAVIAGAGGALVAGPLNADIASTLGLATDSVYFAPVIEETAKLGLLVGLVSLERPRLREEKQTVSYPHAGMIAGTVFMLLERFTDAMSASLGLQLTSLEEIPVHPVTTGIAAYSIANGRLTRRILVLLPISILIHASFNFVLRTSSLAQLPYVWTVALEGFWVAFLLMGYLFRRKKPKTETKPTEISLQSRPQNIYLRSCSYL
jgi:hypothetical protein